MVLLVSNKIDALFRKEICGLDLRFIMIVFKYVLNCEAQSD